MKRVELKHIAIRPPNPLLGWEPRVHRALFALFVTGWLAAWAELWLPSASFGRAPWLDGVLLLSCAGSTLASLTRQLPAQNVVLAAVVIGLIGGSVQAVGAFAGIPFGPLVYNPQHVGKFVFYPLPWSVPVIWVIAILNARGVARIMLRFRRGHANYGFWVIGLTVLLVVLLELSFEPYATQVKEYWSWKSTKIASTWYSTPWVNFLGWAVCCALILLFVTPALINKSPVPTNPAVHPLLVWELLSLLFLTGHRQHHLPAAVIFTLSQMAAVAVLSLLGAKSTRKRLQTANSRSSSARTVGK